MGQRGSPEMLQELVDREERLPEPAGRAHPRVWEPGLGRCEQTEIDPVYRGGKRHRREPEAWAQEPV